jgi:hypothetical protein|nr:MAG TPA: hypothetical protein [Caudoviricetes sp.]
MEIIDLRKNFTEEELRNFMRVFSSINKQVDNGDSKDRWELDDDLITAPMLMWGNNQIASMFVSINRLYDKCTHEMMQDTLKRDLNRYQVESVIYTFNLSSCIAIGNRSIKVISPDGEEYSPNYLSMSSTVLYIANEEGDRRKAMVVTYSYGKYASKSISTTDTIAMEACRRSVVFLDGNFLNDTMENISAMIHAFKLNTKKDYRYVMAETLRLPEVAADALSEYVGKEVEKADSVYEHDSRIMVTLATIPSIIMRYSPEMVQGKFNVEDDHIPSMLN